MNPESFEPKTELRASLLAVPCLVCAGRNFGDLFNGRAIGSCQLKECKDCGMVQAFAFSGKVEFSYTEYGDYLLLSDQQVWKRVRNITQKMGSVFRYLKRKYVNPIILDFGSGAGYLCKAAEEFGINTYGVELSDKLITASKTLVNFTKVFKKLEDIDCTFDAVFMADVIEHLDPTSSRKTMNSIVARLNPGGLLIGNTPNFRSANILLCGDRDPVIAPPSHLCYFTRATLHEYLRSLGLTKVELYSRHLSSNSFFRKSKFQRSFLEKGIRQTKIPWMPMAVFLRVAFGAAGYIAQPFGLGYQIYFRYRK